MGLRVIKGRQMNRQTAWLHKPHFLRKSSRDICIFYIQHSVDSVCLLRWMLLLSLYDPLLFHLILSFQKYFFGASVISFHVSHRSLGHGGASWVILPRLLLRYVNCKSWKRRVLYNKLLVGTVGKLMRQMKPTMWPLQGRKSQYGAVPLQILDH